MKLPDFFTRKKLISILALFILVFSCFFQKKEVKDAFVTIDIDDSMVPLSDSFENDSTSDLEDLDDSTDLLIFDDDDTYNNSDISDDVEIDNVEDNNGILGSLKDQDSLDIKNSSENQESVDSTESIESTNDQESSGEVLTSSKIAFYYLNIRNLDFEGINMKKCYYVGKGSVLEETCDGVVKNVTVDEAPEYNGEVGRYDYEWAYIDDSPGYYCVYGSVTPAADIQTDKMALYYLNIKNLGLDNIDYKKCYYVGKGSVTETEDYKGNISLEVLSIPEYNGSMGKYSISWDKITDVPDKDYYMVFGTVTPSENTQTEKMALYYLNTRNLDLNDINYKKCYYVGKGSVIEDEDYKGKISVSPSIIPDYNGEVGNYLISWDKISDVTDKNYYMVFGTVTKKESSFDNIEALKNAKAIVAGDVVTTKGFYASGDGGAAEYTISDSSTYSSNDNRSIKLANGLYALLNIANNTVCANQLGAYGDGQHDDVVALQKIVDSGLNVSLCSGQTYKFISDALFITNPIIIEGNGATILVDDSYSPQKGDSKYYLIRNVYGNKVSSFNMNNINIKVNFSDNRISGREFVAVSPLLVNRVSLDHVNVETSNTNNCITCVWVDNGCDSVSITNCNFVNNTTGATGGSLWLTAKKDKVFNEFNDLKDCKISNTHLFSASADEVLGFWGTNNITADVSNCTIEGDIRALGRTRVVSIVSQGDNHARVNVNMNNCIIKSNCNTSNTSSYYDSVFGIGTDYQSNDINVNIANCKVYGTVYGSLIFPSCFRSEHVTRFDANDRPVSIKFTGCDIECSSTITGTATNYYNTGAEYPTSAWDCSFNDCTINCGTAFAYLYIPGNAKYYIPKIEINNCDIQVDSAKAFICQAEQSASIDLEINETDITAKGVNDIIKSKSSKQRTLTTQRNGQDQTTYSDVNINGQEVSE